VICSLAFRKAARHGPVRRGRFRFDGDAVLPHNLLDDLIYRVYSNMGREGLAALRPGMLAMGRIVPLHPATDAWLVTGHYSPFPKSARKQIAMAARDQLAAHPELARRRAPWRTAPRHPVDRRPDRKSVV